MELNFVAVAEELYLAWTADRLDITSRRCRARYVTSNRRSA